MRWRDRQESSNVEDRRGMGGRGGLAVGGGLGTIVILLLAAFCGVDPRQLLNQMPQQGGAPGTQQERQLNPEEEELAKFVRVVLRDTEEAWAEVFSRQVGAQYRNPTLVLFTDQVQSGCGVADAGVGPFYCSADEKLYIDLQFYRELKERFGAPGDFAQAYVIAHEVGHHVQNLLGTMDKVHSMQGRLSQGEYNKYSVRLELQADYYAGVWAHYAQQKGYLEAGDVDEALNAARQIGDDTIQRRMQGRVVPDSFTHGTSDQRQRWFRRGLESGDVRQGDTFNARDL